MYDLETPWRMYAFSGIDTTRPKHTRFDKPFFLSDNHSILSTKMWKSTASQVHRPSEGVVRCKGV